MIPCPEWEFGKLPGEQLPSGKNCPFLHVQLINSLFAILNYDVFSNPICVGMQGIYLKRLDFVYVHKIWKFRKENAL